MNANLVLKIVFENLFLKTFENNKLLDKGLSSNQHLIYTLKKKTKTSIDLFLQYISGPYKTTQITAAPLLPRRRRVDDAQVLGQSSSTAAPHDVLIQRNLSLVPRRQGTYCNGRSSQLQLLVQSFYLVYCGSYTAAS